MVRAVIDEPGLDTFLARELHRRGLATGPLRVVLDQARLERGHAGGATLARRLLRAGAVSEPLLREALAAVSPAQTALQHSLAASREAAPIRPTGPPHDPWQPGRRGGGYELKDRRGAGAMGLVFVAEHAETGARYALKTCPRHAEGEHLARFRREGEAQARVDAHPSIVRVHALHEVDGRPFLIMDLAAGGDLDRRVRREGPLAPAAAAALVRDLARGLAHMHARGVLHRDLKPANVLFDERGGARLVDFGLARFEGGQSLTHTGDLIGTPAFMAPEQALGRRDLVGPASDVYGLGSVLFYALTGQPPARGRQVVQVLTDVIEGPVPSPRQLRPEVPAELDAICRAALAKKREERPDAAGLAAALEGWLERGERPEPPRSGWARRAAALAFAAAGIATLGAVAAGSREQAAEAPATAARAPEVERSAPPPPRGPAPLWRWRVGESRRFRLLNTGSMSNQYGPGKVTFGRTLVLVWTAQAVSERAVRVEATIERLALEGALAGARALPATSFDSARASDADEAGMAAIGRRLAFTLDPLTGAVEQVSDVAAVQSAIFAAATGESGRLGFFERQRWSVWELSSDLFFERMLELLLRVRPDAPPAEEPSTWRLAAPRYPDLQQRIGGVLRPVELEVSGRAENGLRHLTWFGRVDEAGPGQLGRALEGQAAYDEDGLVTARLRERWHGEVIRRGRRRRGGEERAWARPISLAVTLSLERL